MADFVLGRLKFKWRGDWAQTTAYIKDDIVKYGANTYVCVINHTSGATDPDFYTDFQTSNNWNLHTEGLRFLAAEHTGSTFYKLNDVVKFGAQQYRCTTFHTSNADGILNTSNFAVYNEGLQFEDSWDSSTYYQDGDVVTYGGYTYVAKINHSGSTPFGNSDQWEVLTTGFNATGDYDAATNYKTGDTMQFGGWSYVCIQDAAAGQTPSSHSAKWEVINEGMKWNNTYSNATTYQKGDVVEYASSSYIAVAYDVLNVDPNSDASKWRLMSQGDSNAVLAARGDIMIKDAAAQTTRLSIGTRGSVLTTDGQDVVWSKPESATVYYVSNSGSDTNEGTQHLPFKTIKHATSVATSGDVVDVDTITGGTGGTPGVYNGVTGTASQDFTVASTPDTTSFTIQLGYSTLAHTYVNGGTVTKSDSSTLSVTDAPYNNTTGVITITTSGVHGLSVGNVIQVAGLNYTCARGSKTYPAIGTNSTYRITTDGSSTPLVEITDGGSHHTVGNTITITAAQIGNPGADLTMNVQSINVGDVIIVKNGVYREILPMQVKEGVSVYGETLRGTEIRPAAGNGHQVATVNNVAGGIGGTPGTFKYVHQDSTTGSGVGFVANVTTDGSNPPTITVYHGGFGHLQNDTITINGSKLGGSSACTFQVASTELNNASNLFLCNNNTNITMMSFKGLTGTPVAGATGKAAVVSLDPSGTISTASPYIQNCTSVSTNNTGIQIDGNLHAAGYKSILANDFTQINSDGIGVHALNKGRGEMVSVFTYYCAKGMYATGGGFIRALNCSSGYGEEGLVADGNDENEEATYFKSRGSQLEFNSTSFVGLTNDENNLGIGDVLTGATSGATATIYFLQTSAKYIYIDPVTGTFEKGETINAVKPNSTTYTFALSSTFGDSTVGNPGIVGFLLPIKTEDPEFEVTVTSGTEFTTTLGTSNVVHTYVSGGVVTKPDTSTVAITNAPYNNVNGLLTITTGSAHGLTTGDMVKLANITYTCSYGTKVYPRQGALGETQAVKLGGNLKIGNNYHRITQVTEENTSAQTAIIKINPQIVSGDALAPGVSVAQTTEFSNIRTTGHDFLDIGTGDIVTSNYPTDATQPSEQSDETSEVDGGRVYYTSTDQKGDFRVGSLFKIEQATGTATLNADAFDLSGLAELQLGSIGASLGATINEFSTDQTLAGDSNNAVPTEYALVGYTQRQKMGVGHMVPPIGNTAQRPSNSGVNLFQGGIRFNTDKNTWEGYNGTQWGGLGGLLPWSTITGDGSTITDVVPGTRAFVNTDGGSAEVRLPASPLVGDELRFLDLVDKFATNNLTINRNGNKIMGLTQDFTISTDNASIGLVYTGASYGWKLTENV